MSGILGINYLDKRPVQNETLGMMVNTLAHRGPDAANIWTESSIGLGHTLLRTTPKSLHEIMPLKIGRLVITADARIDNRNQLIRLLDDLGKIESDIPDSLLILFAYQKWGEKCPEMLLGDFAFAIWDESNQKLFCARDYFGVQPFYYSYKPGQYFVFGSEIKAILCVEDVPRRLNEVRVANHLQGELLQQDKTTTFYRDIFRLPPAHSLTVTPERIKLDNYWSLDPNREIQYNRSQEYADAFHEIFTEAVRCRLRSNYPVGSELSGGLDSSSVTCVARKIYNQNGHNEMHTISGIFDDVPECDERSYINPVLAQGDYISHFVHADQFGPMANYEYIQKIEDEPLVFPNTYAQWYLFAAARDQGIRVLLDGEDGDSVVSYGYAYLSELARAGQWSAFKDEVDALSNRYNTSSWSYLKNYGLSYITELAKNWQWFDFIREANQISNHYNISFRNLFLNYGIKPLAPKQIRKGWKRLRHREIAAEGFDYLTIRPDFVRRLNLRDQIRTVRDDRNVRPKTVREGQIQTLTSGMHALLNETYGKLASSFSIELRHPFFDRRVVEFSLALPPQQKLHDGWSRRIMRQAMNGILPKEVQWRIQKTNFTPNFVHGLLTYESENIEKLMLEDINMIDAYVDVAALREIFRQFKIKKSPDLGLFGLWPSITLAYWLRSTGLS